MSDALNYLIKTRPDAIKSYFDFLKKSSNHLDNKTRDLISIITKVAVKTEPGLRQYLKRALNNGCSANEIIDSLLTAFPALGFSKIIWAIDIIIDMNIVEFKTENINKKTSSWHEISTLKNLIEKKVMYFSIDNNNIYVYRDKEDKFKVFNSNCPHQNYDIPISCLEDNYLTCPEHGWKFDLENNGKCIDIGNKDLDCFEYKIVNNKLLAYW